MSDHRERWTFQMLGGGEEALRHRCGKGPQSGAACGRQGRLTGGDVGYRGLAGKVAGP